MERNFELKMQNNGIYSLLIGVGDYRQMNITNLSTYKSDVMLMGESLTNGLKISKENIHLYLSLFAVV